MQILALLSAQPGRHEDLAAPGIEDQSAAVRGRPECQPGGRQTLDGRPAADRGLISSEKTMTCWMRS